MIRRAHRPCGGRRRRLVLQVPFGPGTPVPQEPVERPDDAEAVVQIHRRTIAEYGFRVLRTPTRMRLEDIAERLCTVTSR